MKLLLDTCVFGGAVLELRQAGYDVVWSGDRESDPGDAELPTPASEEERIRSRS